MRGMATLLYCWRCDLDVPMLTEDEWAWMNPVLMASVRDIHAFRASTGATLHEALQRPFGHDALELHFAMTGMRETNVDALWHHRASLYGPPCTQCGKPLRTPRAKLRAACGADVRPADASQVTNPTA